MPSISFSVERELPCACLALATTPFPACPECGGDGAAWQEIEVEVEYYWHRGSRGSLYDPPEDGHAEIESVTDARGVTVELTSREEERALGRCEEDASERERDRALDYAED